MSVLFCNGTRTGGMMNTNNQATLAAQLFEPSDQLVALFLVSMKPESGLRILKVSELKIFINSIILSTLEFQIETWASCGRCEGIVGSIHRGISFPWFETAKTSFELNSDGALVFAALFKEVYASVAKNSAVLENGILYASNNQLVYTAPVISAAWMSSARRNRNVALSSNHVLS